MGIVVISELLSRQNVIKIRTNTWKQLREERLTAAVSGTLHFLFFRVEWFMSKVNARGLPRNIASLRQTIDEVHSHRLFGEKRIFWVAHNHNLRTVLPFAVAINTSCCFTFHILKGRPSTNRRRSRNPTNPNCIGQWNKAKKKRNEYWLSFYRLSAFSVSLLASMPATTMTLQSATICLKVKKWHGEWWNRKEPNTSIKRPHQRPFTAHRWRCRTNKSPSPSCSVI